MIDNLAGRRSPEQGQCEEAADKCYLAPAPSHAEAARTYDTVLASLPSHNPIKLVLMEVRMRSYPKSLDRAIFKFGEGMRNCFIPLFLTVIMATLKPWRIGRQRLLLDC